jgi:alcohol dehydrogenase class IV
MQEFKNLRINSNIVSGDGSIRYLSTFIKENNFKSPAILIDKNLYESSEYISTELENLTPDPHIIIYSYKFEPTYQLLDQMVSDLNVNNLKNKIDVWIGIGGGSTMDTAKGLAILCKNEPPSIKYKGFPEKLKEPLPVIAVPSTTGTGSEVVYNASFIDQKSKIKMGINYKKSYPILAILDPRIPSTAPLSVLESSGCDTLVHCLESFMSVKTNEHVRKYSKSSYKLIMENMPLLLMNKGSLNNWENMQWASVYAMYALSNCTAGPTGALSYYLGTNFNVNHGVAGGTFLGKVCSFNHKNGFHDFSELTYQEESLSLDQQEKSSNVVDEINSLLKLAKIPRKLSRFGVKDSDLDGFYNFTVQAKEAFSYNPIKVSPETAMKEFVII